MEERRVKKEAKEGKRVKDRCALEKKKLKPPLSQAIKIPLDGDTHTYTRSVRTPMDAREQTVKMSSV